MHGGLRQRTADDEQASHVAEGIESRNRVEMSGANTRQIDEAKLPDQFGPAKNLLWKANLPGRGNSSPIITGWSQNLHATF
jgi:hypothetical protein